MLRLQSRIWDILLNSIIIGLHDDDDVGTKMVEEASNMEAVAEEKILSAGVRGLRIGLVRCGHSMG